MVMKVVIKASGWNFTAVPRTTAMDERLSYAARGLLLGILSRPEGWEANADELSRAAREARGDTRGEGRRAMRALFAELEEAGYMRRTRKRLSGGVFFTLIEVCDLPNAWDESAPQEPRAPFPLQRQDSVVYVIGERPQGVVKIGTTSSLRSRLGDIQTSSPHDLRVLWSFGGDWRLESHLHNRFDSRKIRGEWFDFSDADAVVAVSEATDTYYLVPLGTCTSWS
ncbi:GIY-YIG nuclease family protein [Streptomyces yunnanensis]|uniref:Meiotically up-regulated gene 113 n=1 Tax=Streptomyces yunnanensis TaxID=156453 RepID=A0A9X8MT80_9ACTN|nr:GIY-YIG nuclease family protein [Streptomyces yunnanensis]SHL74385.1 Meiotically up-regulated gene 113 [Streptomyces yunnanensis]